MTDHTDVPFTNIAASAEELFAIDAQGGVWKYFPADNERQGGENRRFSVWVRLTNRRSDRVGKKPGLVTEEDVRQQEIKT